MRGFDLNLMKRKEWSLRISPSQHSWPLSSFKFKTISSKSFLLLFFLQQFFSLNFSPLFSHPNIQTLQWIHQFFPQYLTQLYFPTNILNTRKHLKKNVSFYKPIFCKMLSTSINFVSIQMCLVSSNCSTFYQNPINKKFSETFFCFFSFHFYHFGQFFGAKYEYREQQKRNFLSGIFSNIFLFEYNYKKVDVLFWGVMWNLCKEKFYVFFCGEN